MPESKPTLHDVGARAGVAARTVSRVINGEPGVSEETHQKVRAAIAEMRFQPNWAARALKSDRSLLIAILNNNPSPHYVADVVRGVSRVCKATNHYLTLEEFGPHDENIVRSVREFLGSVRISGAILVPPLTDDEELLQLLAEHRVAIVRLSPARNESLTDAVFARDADGIDLLVDHLVGIGHRSFGLVAGPPSHLSARVRLAAFNAAFQRHGIQEKQIFREEGDYTYQAGASCARSILSNGRPTAICALNDEMAAGVISALGANRIAIPAQIAVTGFDDSEIARMIWPRLTTVTQSIVEQAASAAHLLVERRLGSMPVRLEHGVALVVRESTTWSENPEGTMR